MINAVGGVDAGQAAQSTRDWIVDADLFTGELDRALSGGGAQSVTAKLAAAFPGVAITENAVAGFAATTEYVAKTGQNASVVISPDMMAALAESEEMYRKVQDLVSTLLAAGDQETLAGTAGPATHRNVSIQNAEIRYIEVERGPNGTRMRVNSLSLATEQSLNGSLIDQLLASRADASGQSGSGGFSGLPSLANLWRFESFVSAEALSQSQTGAASATQFATFTQSFTARIDVVIRQIGVVAGAAAGGLDIFNILSLMGLADPLVLDLGDEGINLTSLEDGVYFDIRGDGTPTRTAFIQGNNAFLYLDRNGNGIVDDANELFGDQGGYANGFAKLAQYDGNGDGTIDENDAIYGELRLWRDVNGDGVNQADESMTLAEAGIKALSLNHDGSLTFDANGNAIADQSTFTRFDGSTGLMADVWLKTRP